MDPQTPSSSGTVRHGPARLRRSDLDLQTQLGQDLVVAIQIIAVEAQQALIVLGRVGRQHAVPGPSQDPLERDVVALGDRGQGHRLQLAADRRTEVQVMLHHVAR